jgi:hypothetical protein
MIVIEDRIIRWLSVTSRYLNTIYPVSSHVKLSSGQIARVKGTAGRPIQRPVVEVFCESNGLVVKSQYVLNLQEHSHIVIVGKADK